MTRETGLISGIPVAKDDVREELVREELDRILEFDGIRNSAMLASFLRYVVEETLAGRAERLKAYTIAVEALNRAEDFDPNESALVRVNARRLRDVLSRYYSIPQNDRGFRIELPPGGYVPQFVRYEQVPDSVPDPVPAEQAAPDSLAGDLGLRLVAAVVIVIGAALAMSGGYYYWRHFTEQAHRDRLAAISRSHPTGTGSAAADLLPQVYVSVAATGDIPDWFHRAHYQRRIEAFAERFNGFVVERGAAQARAQRHRAADVPTAVHARARRRRAAWAHAVEQRQ